MLGRFLPFLLLQVLFSAPSSGSLPSHDLASLSEVCQFVFYGTEKMLDAASDQKNVEEYEEYTTEWIVGITGGPDAADEVAERLGFTNEGLVDSLANCNIYESVALARKSETYSRNFVTGIKERADPLQVCRER